jgi:hypothetical protein
MLLQTRMARYGFLALLLSAAATTVVADTNVRVGLDFNLRVNETAHVRDTNLRLRLEGVDQDSRCPTDVQCIQAGDATVTLIVGQATAKDKFDDKPYPLHTSKEPKSIAIDPYTITLLGLSPQQRSGRQIRPTDYIVTLRITRGK